MTKSELDEHAKAALYSDVMAGMSNWNSCCCPVRVRYTPLWDRHTVFACSDETAKDDVRLIRFCPPPLPPSGPKNLKLNRDEPEIDGDPPFWTPSPTPALADCWTAMLQPHPNRISRPPAVSPCCDDEVDNAAATLLRVCHFDRLPPEVLEAIIESVMTEEVRRLRPLCEALTDKSIRRIWARAGFIITTGSRWRCGADSKYPLAQLRPSQSRPQSLWHTRGLATGRQLYDTIGLVYAHRGAGLAVSMVQRSWLKIAVGKAAYFELKRWPFGFPLQRPIAGHLYSLELQFKLHRLGFEKWLVGVYGVRKTTYKIKGMRKTAGERVRREGSEIACEDQYAISDVEHTCESQDKKKSEVYYMRISVYDLQTCGNMRKSTLS